MIQMTEHLPVKAKEAFSLRVLPARIRSAKPGQPIKVKLVLTNISGQTQKIRIYEWPVAFGATREMNCLQLRCRNVATREEVKYSWPPQILSVADVQGREPTQEVPRGKSWFFPINLRDYCDMPPGRYEVELEYDTESVPSWVKPDKNAWHGATNKVIVRVHVSKVVQPTW